MGIRPAMALVFAMRASLLAIAGPADAQPANYDPLAHAQGTSVAPIDLTIEDTRRDRMIPLRVYLPAATSAAPFILFSHGLGGRWNACAMCRWRSIS